MYPVKYDEYVVLYSDKYNIDTSLVYSVMKNESGFSENARSMRDAIGLMQITADTGAWIASEISVTDYSLSDPETNIMFSCWYLEYLTDRFDNLETALAAYNAGEGVVSRWLKDPEISSNGSRLDIIPYGETDRYVKRVINTYNIYNKLY